MQRAQTRRPNLNLDGESQRPSAMRSPVPPSIGNSERVFSVTRGRRTGRLLWAAAGAALIAAAAPAFGWSSMRCGNRLVGLGDSLYEVRSTCGEPDQLDHFVEYRTVRHVVSRTCTRGQGGAETCRDVYAERTVEVPIHQALYDFGSNRFIENLTFESGRLVRIETGSYGKKPPGSR